VRTVDRTLLVLLVSSVPTHVLGGEFYPAPQNGIPDYYVVVLDPGATNREAAAEELGSKYEAEVTYVYQEVLHAFEAAMDEATAIDMAGNPLVSAVYQDSWIAFDEAFGAQIDHCYPGLWPEPPPTSTNQRDLPPIPPCAPGTTCVQTLFCPQPGPNPTDDCIDNWGLDRIDQISGFAAPDEEFNYRSAATGVMVYTLDVGIRATNREFESAATGLTRVAPGADVMSAMDCDPGPCPVADQDCYRGHGTHVAGIIGGRTFGVAKDVTLVPIRFSSIFTTFNPSPPCLNGNQHVLASSFKRGLDRIAILHSTSSPTAVVNISGGNVAAWVDPNDPFYGPVRTAMINLASRDNILIVQSAGNQGSDACDHSFGNEAAYSGAAAAAIARIVVVGGFDPDLGQFVDTALTDNASNFGPCVDIWAPAADIVSSGGWQADPVDNRVCRLTGTSMAAPHVSGVAALLLQEKPFTSPEQLKASLVEWATYNTLGLASGHPIGPGSPNVRVRRAEDVVFEDGFSFDRSRWSSEVMADGGTLSVCLEAAMPVGTLWQPPSGEPNGLCVGLPGATGARAYVVDQRPVAEATYYALFFADYSGLSMQPNDNHVIFLATDAAGNVLSVRQRGDGFVRLDARDNSGEVQPMPWIDHGIHAGSTPVMISWQAGIPGLARISVDGGILFESLSLENGERRIEQVALGAVSGVDASTTGVLRIDTFGSWRQGFRGMLGICHPAFETTCDACCNP